MINVDLQQEVNTIFLKLEDEVLTNDEARLKVFDAIEDHAE